ncbi:hypothetical protein LG299_00450 [Microbacterium lacus]|uniref:hypothetical protein n=1 Tax=Microbacterium lacus TaxID=415217 RepID=UPI00384E0522
MSSPQTHIPPFSVRERAACMCSVGGSCSSFAPGHALHLIQARLASATPSEWSDAFVESVDRTSGEIVVRTFDGEAIRLWSGAGAAVVVESGAPVALHARYDVLAVGRERFNVLTG